MPDELKEGDEVVLRGEVCNVYPNHQRGLICVSSEKGDTYHILSTYELRKVRPGTYEVTARDVAKMICRARRELPVSIINELEMQGRLESHDFKTLRRWVHCRLRELRRKRGGR